VCTCELYPLGYIKTNNFRSHTYRASPSLNEPENNIALLLVWVVVYRDSTVDCDRQLKVLRRWTFSKEGWNWYMQLARNVQDPQSVEQLALITAAMFCYRLLVPDCWDSFDQPVNSSYLEDLHALLQSQLLGNSGVVSERMILGMIRVLSCSEHDYETTISFLWSLPVRDPLPLHIHDGLTDQYIRQRIQYKGYKGHNAGYAAVVDELSVLRMRCLEINDDLRDDDSDWVHISQPCARYDTCLPKC
jgi:hypothetical protein